MGVTPCETGAQKGKLDPPPLLQPRGDPANHIQGTEDNFEKQDGERNKTKS